MSDTPPVPSTTPHSTSSSPSAHVRALVEAPFRHIRDDLGFFAGGRAGAFFVTSADARALIAALDAYDARSSRPDDEIDAHALAAIAARACLRAMTSGRATGDARRCARALDACGALASAGFLRGRVRGDTEIDVKAIDALEGVEGDLVGNETLNEALFRAACACGELAGESGGESKGDDETRARCGTGTTGFILATCAIAREGVGEKEEEEERDDDGKVEEGALPGRLRARGDALMRAIRAVFHVAMIGDDDTVRRAAKTALTQVINATFKRAEKDFERLSSGESSTPTTSEALGDVERLLLTLCKIAAKEGSVAVDAYLAHSKALALDVLRQLMEGPRATSWLERLHASLRQPLSVALARNALLQVPQGAEAEQSVGILVSLARMAYGTLVVRARSTWKQQVAALYPIMAIHPLESGEASAAMRVSALRLIRRLASDSQVLVDLFVNYDCDLHAENLYERTVTALAKSAQVSDVLERDAVLTCLFSILRSLQAWHARGDGSASTEDGEETSTVEDDDPRFDGELRPVMTTTRRSRGSGGVAVAAAAATVVNERAFVDGASASKNETNDAIDGDNESITNVVDEKAAESEAERFQKAKQTKVSVEKATEAFNADASVRTLQQAARSEDPTECANFLRKSAAGGRLSPSAIGELLGSHEADALAVMRAYVHGFDFASSHIDDALRSFLGGFKLPGEAQKIDRLMEAFAARFCACNHDAYPCAEAAYILAFAIVMLNTDAHNPLTDDALKMNREDFIVMVTAAEATTKLDRESVAAIYDRVVTNEIKMHAAEPTAPSSDAAMKTKTSRAERSLAQALNFAAPWRHRSTLKEASDATVELLKRTKALFQSVEDIETLREGDDEEASSALFVRASEPGLARPMLAAAGKFMLIALSSAFETAPDAAHAAMPLEGARAVLSLATRLQLPTLRDDICAFLVTAPGIGRPEGIASQCKEALSTLLELAASELNLGGVQAWVNVLEIVARLEHLRVVLGAGVSFDHDVARGLLREPLATQERNDLLDVSSSTAMTSDRGRLNDAERAVTDWLLSSGAEAVERVYASSARFDSDEIIAYASAIATVSRHELWEHDCAPRANGRVFALLRLTEVAATNMTRVRLVWSKLWAVVAEHLVESVKHPDEKVVLHATDSLRQVANRSLMRARATRSAATQVDAMKPFVAALENAKTARARGLVTSCVAQALHRFGDSLGNGWEPVLDVLETTYGDEGRGDGDATIAAEAEASCRAARDALTASLDREPVAEGDEDEDLDLGIPVECVERAVRLMVLVARDRRRRRDGDGDGDGDGPLAALVDVARACRSKLASGAVVNAWTTATWSATCDAFGELARDDDDAIDALFALLDDDESERLREDAWAEAKTRAIEASLQTTVDAAHACRLIAPRVIALIRDRRAAYEALLPTVWAFAARALRSNAAAAVAAALESVRAAIDVAVARGESREEHWRAMCQVLRGGVTIDTVMLDLPNAGDVVSRALACVGACDATRRVDSLPTYARDDLVRVLGDVYAFARGENDRVDAAPGALARLEFAAGDAYLRATRDDVDARDAFLEHVERVLTDECAERPNDEDESDDDVSLRSNALRPMRERLAARALAALDAESVDSADVARLGPAVVAAVRGATRHPLANELAAFFESSSVRKKLGIITA